MDRKALIALLALIPALVFGQPMTVSELSWPGAGTNGVPCAQTISANGMVLIVPTNSVSAITLNGAGGVFAISVAPTNGTLTGLNTATGDATYTASPSIGVDHFEFSVTGAGGCVTNAPVDVGITTNTVGCFDSSGISHTGQRIGVVINTGNFGRDVLVCLQYTNANCVLTNDCKQSLGMGMVPFSVVEGIGCPNNSLCYSVTTPCSGLPDTNTFTFSQSGLFNNFNYATWTICNSSSSNRTYQLVGVQSWQVGFTPSFPFPNSTAAFNVQTNGTTIVASVVHTGGVSTQSGVNVPTTLTFTVPANTENLAVNIWLILTQPSGAPTPTFSGTFTNSFQ